MKSLFEITQEVMELASLLENGEYTPELEEQLIISQEELQEKAINYCKVIKSFEGDVSLIDIEVARLNGLKASKEKTIERMKESVSSAMQLFHVEKIQTPLMKISFRKSEVLEITDESLLPKFYIRINEISTVDKSHIKRIIKSGGVVPGAKIVEKQNLQIK